MSASSGGGLSGRWYDERLYLIPGLGYAQRFQVTRIVARARSAFQDIVVFENPAFGRVLALDGAIQATEKDEFVYHEMLTHVPILAHGRVRQVLIVGGGDGGVLREVLRHRSVERATMVEIDGKVVDLCREHMPSLSAGAFDDARAEVVIDDGIKFVTETERRFDVIVVDSTDPAGPGEVLFGPRFYKSCHERLTRGGIVVTQNGVPFFQAKEDRDTSARLKPWFADFGFYVAACPSYVGGFMALAWATDDKRLRRLSLATLAARFRKARLETRYYTPAVHVGAFNLPPYVATLMKQAKRERWRPRSW